MLNRTFFSFILFLFTPILLIPQGGGNDFPILTDRDLSGWKITETRFYAEKELYGYINGGAELYREYGFSKLAVQRVKKGSSEIQVEIYRMKTPEAAFGVFSISRGQCRKSKVCEWSCASPGQVTFAFGHYFVNILSYDRSQAEIPLQDVAIKIVKKIPSGENIIPADLNHPPFSSHRSGIRFINGPVGIQNGFAEWSDLFEDFEKYESYILPLRSDKDWATFAQIQFKDERDTERFFKKAGFIIKRENNSNWNVQKSGKIWRAIRVLDSRSIYFLESAPASVEFDKILGLLK